MDTKEQPSLSSPFTIRLSTAWLHKPEQQETEKIKRIIGKPVPWLGIYRSIESKVLADPIQVGDGTWEYPVKLETVKYYFLWVCYKTEKYE